MMRYNGKRRQVCYDCGKAGCECSVRASSRTYRKVNRMLCTKFGVSCPETGYPSEDFAQLLNHLQSIAMQP